MAIGTHPVHALAEALDVIEGVSVRHRLRRLEPRDPVAELVHDRADALAARLGDVMVNHPAVGVERAQAPREVEGLLRRAAETASQPVDRELGQRALVQALERDENLVAGAQAASRPTGARPA